MSDASVDECPECGATMMRRANRRTGDYFFGCSRYPDCTGTRAMTNDAVPDAMPSQRARQNDRKRWER